MFLADALKALRVCDVELFWKRLVLCGTPSWGCIISQNSYATIAAEVGDTRET